MSTGEDITRVVNSPIAQAGWKTVMALLTALAVILGYLVNDKLADLKDLSKSVKDLSTTLADVRSDMKASGVMLNDHERRIGKLEDWRNSKP